MKMRLPTENGETLEVTEDLVNSFNFIYEFITPYVGIEYITETANGQYEIILTYCPPEVVAPMRTTVISEPTFNDMMRKMGDSIEYFLKKLMEAEVPHENTSD